MEHRRSIALLAILCVGGLIPAAPAAAEPMTSWDTLGPGYDCVNQVHLGEPGLPPEHPDHDSSHPYDVWGDPKPGTPQWQDRDTQHVACNAQRDHDRRFQYADRLNGARYGEDWYRQPIRFDNVRFRYDYFPLYNVGDPALPLSAVPAAEVYRPCPSDPSACPDLPDELDRFDPPYPVVVIHHGGTAQMTHHRYNAQPFAEAGYLAITVNGVHPLTGVPNVQSNDNGDRVLRWLGSGLSGEIGQQADLDRVAFVGHSQGSAASLSYQNDDRVHTIIAWDGGDTTSPNNHNTPIMYQRTDGGFATPTGFANSTVTAQRNRLASRAAGYNALRDRGLDTFHFTARATSHVSWVGYGSGLDGNRLIELVINYYNLAWLDKQLKGRLAIDDDGNVITYGGRTEAEERAYRQAIALEAFGRLTADVFDDSADRHNISMGFFDPDQYLASDDKLWGGNVPYKVEGLSTADRLSPYYRSRCHLTVPDYVAGSDGSPGGPIATFADTTTDYDIRHIGCPEGGPPAGIPGPDLEAL